LFPGIFLFPTKTFLKNHMHLLQNYLLIIITNFLINKTCNSFLSFQNNFNLTLCQTFNLYKNRALVL
jgi:hypothetical protein